ncbi:zinc finger protein 395 [Chiroxiphia lanceolata]|uniref:zinc finger protein 395 n=1 Tax=Chiroxiphia lanceolata TaxID=296741 RepID=UPI0013CE6F54|nr:zinc finger protein 395 [Chiroxiphia lanceolata]
MATALSRRLGKRSLLGTRVPADGMQIPGLQPEPGRAPAAPEDGSCALSVEENSQAPGFPGLRQLHSGQQVLITSNGQECEQGKVLLPEQGSQGCWRVQDTLQPPAEILQRSVSSSIDVPKRKVRGEAKKCRKVYGIEHRDQWCTACRWKKACQRFLD